MDLEQLRNNIIKPALKPLGIWNLDIESILCATAAQETNGGKFVLNLGSPAMGIYQMLEVTHNAMWKSNFQQVNNLQLVRSMLQMFGFGRVPISFDLVWHNGYATFMAAFYYQHLPDKLPPATDLKAQWEIYNRYWKLPTNQTTEETFYKNINDYFGLRKKRK